jgi:hypothetical protein
MLAISRTAQLTIFDFKDLDILYRIMAAHWLLLMMVLLMYKGCQGENTMINMHSHE